MEIPVQAFGLRLNTVVGHEFEERGIHGFKGVNVSGIEPGVAHYQNGETRKFDLLVAFPPYIAKETYGALPSGDRGFIQVASERRRVKGQTALDRRPRDWPWSVVHFWTDRTKPRSLWVIDLDEAEDLR